MTENYTSFCIIWASQVVKSLPDNAGDIRDMASIPGLGRSPGGGHGNLLQYSCLENPHGQGSLASHDPWGCKESDTTERATKHIERTGSCSNRMHTVQPS